MGLHLSKKTEEFTTGEYWKITRTEIFHDKEIANVDLDLFVTREDMLLGAKKMKTVGFVAKGSKHEDFPYSIEALKAKDPAQIGYELIKKSNLQDGVEKNEFALAMDILEAEPVKA